MPSIATQQELLQAFEVFTQASRSLERSYHEMEEQVRVLRRELEAKNAALERSARLAAMGEMATRIAHDIRNPLGSIELFATMLREELSGEPRRWADHISTGVRNLDRIVSNLLQFTRPRRPVLQEVQLGPLLEETMAFCRPLFAQTRVKATLEVLAALPVIMGDRELLRQVFLNLFLNAVQAMPDGGMLRVAAEVRSPKSEVRSHSEDLGPWTSDLGPFDAGPGFSRGPLLRIPPRGQGNGGHGLAHGAPPFVEISISDTGMGIPPEHWDRIFDPFFTTKEAGGGTGLGLAIVHQILENLNGGIAVESVPDRGTTFTVWLPGVGNLESRGSMVERPREWEEKSRGANDRRGNGASSPDCG